MLSTTEPLDLRSSTRRFFAEYPLFRPVDAGGSVKRPVSEARLSLELWPPGSSFPQEGAGALPPSEVGRPWPPDAAPSCASSYAPGCPFCDGLGRRRCGGCRGHGALVCEACDGMPALPCGRCHGTGTLRRGLVAIGGAGAAGAAVAASRCTACWGSALAGGCRSCFGVGALRCGSCCGAGWLPCARCVPRGPALR